ncbi:MAG: DNA repair exonuclease [Gemmatimonadetes bacterium]|nr:DNA repair exonuclease [Gemmatimonadota bacterium]
MRVLHFADLHLDAAFAGLGPAAGRMRRRAIRGTLHAIADLAVEEKVEAVLCAGDLYEHDRIVPDTVAFLCEVFGRLQPIRVYIAPGNHDWHGAASVYRRSVLPGNVHVFDGDRFEAAELAEGLTLWGAAFRAPRRETGFLDGFRVDRGGVHVALFHGSEGGSFRFESSAKQRYAPFRREQIAEAGLLHAFVGHHHTPVDDELFTYPGNPDPLTFGESGPRGAVLADIRTDRVTRRRVAVARTVVHDLVLDVSGCMHADSLRERLVDLLGGRRGFARVTIQGDLSADFDLRLADLAGVRGESRRSAAPRARRDPPGVRPGCARGRDHGARRVRSTGDVVGSRDGPQAAGCHHGAACVPRPR